MIDALAIVTDMINERYAPLSGETLSYDDAPPEYQPPPSGVYAVVNVQGVERAYLIQGGGGRHGVDFTIRLYGRRNEVGLAANELPTLLTAPYWHKPTGVTMLYAHLLSAGGIGRAERPAAQAAQILRFEADFAQTHDPEPAD